MPTTTTTTTTSLPAATSTTTTKATTTTTMPSSPTTTTTTTTTMPSSPTTTTTPKATTTTTMSSSPTTTTTTTTTMSSSSTTKTLPGPLTTTTTVPPTPMVKSCQNPPLLKGGTILTSGPYLANMTYATFSCFTGFTLQGTGQVFCRSDASWSGSFPTCVPVSNQPSVDTNITFGDYGNIPMWLAITMGVTFGVICLLLLACLCMYCLKICGCWRGPIHRNGGMSHYEGCCCCYYPPERVAPSPCDDMETYNSVEHHGKTRYQRGRPSQVSIISNPEAAVQAWKEARQKKAKIPEERVWMPHSQQIRKINTSTQ